ncbi:MAG: phosphatase PAP2 family protein [Gammaproteobacteria bacterium]|nr:phosphatase PAP2 family protein [Gammaproteobacteria bacterium]
MPAGFWWHLTALGDSAVLLPCALLIGVWLLAFQATRRSGWLWLLAVGVDAGGVALTKVLFMGWGLHPPGLDFIGLSGHSALSFLVWPSVALLISIGARGWLRATAIALGVILALTVSYSRVLLHAHTPSEALLGGLWGAGLAALFIRYAWARIRHSSMARRWIAISLLLPLLFVTYGRVFPSNTMLAWVAMRVSGHHFIYTRRDLGKLSG